MFSSYLYEVVFLNLNVVQRLQGGDVGIHISNSTYQFPRFSSQIQDLNSWKGAKRLLGDTTRQYESLTTSEDIKILRRNVFGPQNTENNWKHILRK